MYFKCAAYDNHSQLCGCGHIVIETDCRKQTIIWLTLRKVMRVSTKAVVRESIVKFISVVEPVHLLIGEGDFESLKS